MSRRHRKAAGRPTPGHASAAKSAGQAGPPTPVDVCDGIPDRSSRPAGRRVLWIVLIFLGWVGVLVWIGLAGRL